MKRRFLCVLVALCVAFVLLPVSAKAESPEAQWGVAAADGSKPAEWAGSGTLEAAVTYANELSGNAAYIQLLTDVTAAKTMTFTQGTITLDLNGCTLGAAGSNGVITLSGGTLTIDDSSDGGNGKITSAAGAKDIGTINVSGGSLVVDGGTVENLYNSINGHTISVSSGNVTVNGGKVERTGNYSFAYAINNMGGGTISVNGGIVTGGSYAIYNNDSGTVNVTGGEVSTNGTVILNKGTVHMTGGTVENTNTSQSWTIYNYGSGRVSIDGGEVRGSTPIFMPEYSTSTVNVTGGKVIASLDYAIESQGKGSISVTGGELIGRSCAIRCSEYSTANVSVTGGELTSTSFWTIFNFGSGSLSVADARVEGKSSMYGAIYQRSAGKLTIGGTAVVTSPYQSSTSGTIYMGSGSTLEITGGTVENTNTGTDGLAIFVKDNNGRVSIKSGSPVIIKAPGKAMTIAPDLPDTVVKTAAADINGIDGVETYNPDHIATYKYLEFVPAVAKIGSTSYPTLQAAIDAVENGQTVTLIQDASENITIPGELNRSFTLDLNGKTLNGGADAAIDHSGSGHLTIADSRVGGMVTGSTGISGKGTGEIIILGGTIKGTDGSAISCAQLKIDPAGKVVVKSGTQAMSVAPALPEDTASYQWRTSDEGAFAVGPYAWDSSHTYVEIRPAYTVTYHPGANGAGSQVTDSKTHDIDLTLRGAIFTREGYTQTGWATTDGGTKAFELGGSYTANAAIDLYPVWTPDTYTVTYHPGTNGTGSQATDSKTHDIDLTLRGAVFTREGYTQTGWATTDGGAKAFDLGSSYTTNEPITLYPVWALNTYAVTYRPGSNATGSEATDSKTHDVDLTLRGVLFTRDGYTQTGWATTDGGAKAFDLGGSYTANAAVVLYPVWTANTYTVTYQPGANGTGSQATDTKTYGADLTLRGALFTRIGYTQTGWATTDVGTKAYDLGSSYTANAAIDLYPVWTQNTYAVTLPTGTGYTVTAQDGSSSSPVAHGGSYSFTVTIAEGYREGNSFAVKVNGAPLTADGSSVYTISGITQAQTVTVEGVEQDSPEPTPSPTTPPSTDVVYNDPSKADATIWLTGSGFASGDLLMTQALTGGSNYNALLKLADGNDVFGVYEISLQSGMKSTGSAMYLTFDLEEKYAGQRFTLVHKKADGTFEYFYATAGADGNVKFGPLYELSPFMLVKGTLLDDLDDIPKTGDDSLPWVWWLLGGISAAGVALLIAIDKRKGRAKR